MRSPFTPRRPQIWPWLVQMGVGRGGAYTYDWIEQLFGLDMHSADRVIPELQSLAVGDVIPMRPNDPGMRVEVLEPERALSTRSEDGSWVWSFALVPENASTRLISRNRGRVRTPAERVGMAAMEVGSLVMERRMLAGIRDRAEALARAGAVTAPNVAVMAPPGAAALRRRHEDVAQAEGVGVSGQGRRPRRLDGQI